MSAVVVLGSERQSLQASAERPDEHSDMLGPSSEASLTTRFNAISAALSARRSIAISASALANPAQASVLYLLR